MNIIISPEYDTLKKDISELKNQMSDLFMEEDELRFVICRNIETEYLMLFGEAEFRAYNEQCRYLRLKRQLEMIQAYLNRQGSVNAAEIEKQLDAEFDQYKKNMHAYAEKLNEAVRRKHAPVLNDEEQKEIKKLYRDVMKRLHPDLHPNLTPAQMRIFQNAVDAYKTGDLSSMRIINTLASAEELDESGSDALARLQNEKAHLQLMIDEIKQDINDIKNRYPYNQKELLDNADRCRERKAEIEVTIQKYKDASVQYEKKIRKSMS